MKKAEIIKRYGEAAYERQLEQRRAYYKAHKKEAIARNCAWNKAHKKEAKVAAKKYRETHPEQVKANDQEKGRKGGKYYAKHLRDNRTGLQGERSEIRLKHRLEFREIKDTLAEEVELHHEWIGDTAEYRGMAFVEKKAHRNGFIDVILLLDGEITSHGRIQRYEQ